jgi:hypothetical protein
VLGTTTSPESMVKLLSEENLELLHTIGTRRPTSVRELAALVKRKESNLSRTLKKLAEAGIVGFEAGPGRTRAPRLIARRVRSISILSAPAAWCRSIVIRGGSAQSGQWRPRRFDRCTAGAPCQSRAVSGAVATLL